MLSQLGAMRETGYSANETPGSKARKIRRGKRPSDFFVGRPEGKGGRAGIWERIDTAWGSAIRPIVYFIRPPSYAVRLPFDRIVEDVHMAETEAALNRAMADAILKSGFKGRWK